MQVAGSVCSCFLADEVAAALVVEIGSCIFRAGFAGDHAILAVLPLIGDRPKIFGILVGMDRTGSGRRQLHVHSWFCWWSCNSCCVPCQWWQAHDFGHHGRYGPEGLR